MTKLSPGTVHKITSKIKEAIEASKVQNQWEDITPLARNEFICWISDAKQLTTREKRIRIMCENLKAGKRRPCCWPGCKHR